MLYPQHNERKIKSNTCKIFRLISLYMLYENNLFLNISKNDAQFKICHANTILNSLCDQYVLSDILRYNYSYNYHFVQYSEMQWCLIVCKLHDCCCDCLQLHRMRPFFNNFLFFPKSLFYTLSGLFLLPCL